MMVNYPPQEITVNINDLDEAPVINSGVILEQKKIKLQLGQLMQAIQRVKV